MSEINKTEAVVLSKIDFGDTSNIISIFTKDFGKISAIIKGVKKNRNGKGGIIDPPNYLQIIFYNKSSRDVQLITGAEIVAHYPKIKQDLEKLKFSYAVLELLKKIMPEHEPNHKIFRGTVRVMELLEKGEEASAQIFGRFYMFFLKESGYEIQIDKCSSCGKVIKSSDNLSYNFESGILCGDCGQGYPQSFVISMELFNYLKSLKTNQKINNPGKNVTDLSLLFMEKFTKYHIPGFQGIQTFQILR